ncbi:MAG: SprT family zinc-dependent metalloprotease [Eubacterium sp.]|nr:SprT family zinc-dependent metalloprotease [Eubacterium sp.]
MDYRIVRSKRKRLAIYVKADGSVEVRAPLKYPESEIRRFVEEKADWIEAHSQAAKARQKQREAFTLAIGDTLRLMDGRYPLVSGKKACFDGHCFFVRLEEEIKPQVVALYRQAAREIIGEKVAHWEPRVGASAAGIKINGARTRWGSCSGKNSLNFSWRLMMAPEAAVDYVVVHELCHILERNHSQNFWAQVARVMPDYRLRQQQLKALALQLSREDWEV